MNRGNRPLATALIIAAADFAAFKHRNQRRKDIDASPYINHPIALAALLANEAGITDSVVICAALLHDTIEDTKTTVVELQERFGKTIAAVVMEVTDDKRLPKAERKRLQIVKAGSASRRARLVKLADNILQSARHRIEPAREVESSPAAKVFRLGAEGHRQSARYAARPRAHLRQGFRVAAVTVLGKGNLRARADAGAHHNLLRNQPNPSNSTSKTRVALGGMTPPAPRAP